MSEDQARSALLTAGARATAVNRGAYRMAQWDDLYADDLWRRWAERPPLPITVDWLSALRKRGAKCVYDMGCGLGRHTVALARLGFNVVASDISPRARQVTCERLATAGLRAEVIEADMTGIPYPEGPPPMSSRAFLPGCTVW